MGETVFSASIEGMKHVKSDQGEMLTKPFLEVCKLILPILVNGIKLSYFESSEANAVFVDTTHPSEAVGDYLGANKRACSIKLLKNVSNMLYKFGPGMTIVKSDIGGNISRLEHKYDSNPTRFNYLFNFVQAEVETGTAKASSSCTNGILWLTRAMDFLVVLFYNLSQHPDWGMQQSCNDSYSKTLKKWHGWLASSSFTVAIKLAPDRKRFMDVLGGAENIQADMQKFCEEFSPFLRQIHKFLASFGLDSMKAL